MSNLTQQFNDLDETHLAMSDPVELAKYIIELRGEMETIHEDIREEYNQEYIHPDYVSDYIESDGYSMIEHGELEKLKEQGETIKLLTKEKMIYKEGMEEWRKEANDLLSFQKEVDSMEAGLGEIHEDYEDMRYYDLPKVITDLREEIDKLEKECDERVAGDDHDALMEENKKLRVKANAWDIHYKGSDWEYASQSWDKAQCQALIECGACTEEDFEFHEEYNREDSDEEVETCEECKKPLEGDDKCSEGCPKYDEGWKETHPSE